MPEDTDDLPAFLKPGRPDLAIPEAAGLSEAEAEALRKVADRKRELDHTEAVARGTAIAAVNGLMDEQRRQASLAKDEDRLKLAPFYSYLDSLRELAEEDQAEARTELKLQLFRLEDSGGPKPKRIYCQEFTLDQAEVKSMGDPAFERRTQDYAEKAGRFGRYEWRIKGWAIGELTLDTQTTVHVEPPPGFVMPPNPIIEASPKVDPMEGMNGSLDLISRVAALFGGKKGDSMSPVELRQLETMAYDQGQRAGLTEGKYQAEKEHRKELDDLRERHRRDLEEAEKRGMDRGRVEGAREVKDELTPKIWQLEHQVAGDAPASLASEVVGYLGGPEAVQALVGAVVAGMNKPKAPGAPQPQGRPAPPTQPRTAQFNPSGEPSRAAHFEALGMIEAAVDHLDDAIPRESPESVAQLQQLKGMLEAVHAEGMKEGPMAAWWSDWISRWAPNVQMILNAVEDHEELATETTETEKPMDLEALRGTLLAALDTGKEDAEILEHLKTTIPPEVRGEWRKQIAGWPTAMLAGMIGQGQHQGRLTALLEAFTAAQ